MRELWHGTQVEVVVVRSAVGLRGGLQHTISSSCSAPDGGVAGGSQTRPTGRSRPSQPTVSQLVREVEANCLAANLKPPHRRTVVARLETIDLRRPSEETWSRAFCIPVAEPPSALLRRGSA